MNLSFKHAARVWGAALAGLLMAAGAQAQSTIEGVWVTEQESEMTISPCVEGYCGYISKIVITAETRAKYGGGVDAITTHTDANNEDPALRDRPIQGLQILTLAQGGNADTFEGEIYSPEDGRSSSGELTIVDEDTLKLKGCAFRLFCREEYWRRAEVR